MNFNLFTPMIIDDVKSAFLNIAVWIDAKIYDFIRYIYNIFVNLTQINLFGSDKYSSIINNIYVVLGLIMMFVLAYSLLKAVINPDNFAKGETSFPKLIQNVVVSLVIIAFLPTIFGLAFNVQNALLNANTIDKLIIGNTDDNETYSFANGGNLFAFEAFKAFLNPLGCDSTDLNSADDCREAIKSDNGKNTLSEVDEEVSDGATFYKYAGFTKSMVGDDATLDYSFPISTICGIFLLWVILNFCFDVALRTVKLAFYQIIAPIPVICRIIPGGKLKDTFSSWVKQVISLFFEVFIRIGAMSFGIKMIELINNSGVLDEVRISDSPFLVKAFLIMAVVMFIKQIPGILSKLFNIDTSGMKLGLREKLAAGGGLMAAAAIGTASGNMIRNGVSGVKNIKEARKNGKLGVGAAIGTAGSLFAGGVAGLVRGGNRARGAKNGADVKKAITGGMDASSTSKANRAVYRAAHDKGGGMLDTLANTYIEGRLGDIATNVGSFFGISTGVQDLIDDNKNIDTINSKKKAIKTAVEELLDGEANKEGTNKSYNVSGFNTATLRRLKQEKDAAIASGASNAAQLQDNYDRYRKQFVDEVQKYAYLGTGAYSTMLENYKNSLTNLPENEREKEMRKLMADFGDMRNAASDFRRSVRDSITASYIVESGFTIENIDDNFTLDPKKGPVDNIGDNLKIAKQENIKKINELNQKANENNNK